MSCEGCNAKCCRYIATEIDKPEEEKDFENILWYLLHENVCVFIEEGDWFIQFSTDCKKLDGSKCSYYEDRPTICRELSTENCEYYGKGEPYDIVFKEPDEFLEYAQKNNFNWKRIK